VTPIEGRNEPLPAPSAEPRTDPPRHAAGRSAIPAGGVWREYWAYRELFYFFVWRDIKVRYKQTALGALWAMIQPFTVMIVFSLLFGRVVRLPSDGIPYPIFYYSALVPWLYFSAALNQAGNSLLSASHLITKVYFPRVLIPAASVVTPLFDFAIAAALLLGLMLYHGVPFGWRLLLWPVLCVPLVGLSLGISLLLSALNVRYRDIKHVITFVLQLGMFLSPVVYPLSMIPERFRFVAMLNPLVGMIEAFRASVAGRPIDLVALGVALFITATVFACGYVYFRRTERGFADII